MTRDGTFHGVDGSANLIGNKTRQVRPEYYFYYNNGNTTKS